LKALQEGKVVPYRNEHETPEWVYENEGPDSEETVSYMVPAPHMNLVQFGKKDPLPQQTLPLDLTGLMPQSERTKWFRSNEDE
jgi:hypothetical protein